MRSARRGNLDLQIMTTIIYIMARMQLYLEDDSAGAGTGTT
jgi:hypothetical protein